IAISQLGDVSAYAATELRPAEGTTKLRHADGLDDRIDHERDAGQARVADAQAVEPDRTVEERDARGFEKPDLSVASRELERARPQLEPEQDSTFPLQVRARRRADIRRILGGRSTPTPGSVQAMKADRLALLERDVVEDEIERLRRA